MIAIPHNNPPPSGDNEKERELLIHVADVAINIAEGHVYTAMVMQKAKDITHELSDALKELGIVLYALSQTQKNVYDAPDAHP